MEIMNIPPEQGNYFSHVICQKSFSPEECEKIINFQGKFLPATVYSEDQNSNSFNPEIRQHLLKPLSYNEETAWMYERLKKMVVDANKAYFDINITSMLETQVLQYDVGGFFTLHSDIGNGLASTRKITMVTLLSDKSEYEGGNVTWIPPAPKFDFSRGCTIIFPAYIIHQVSKITKGRRFTLETIVHGPRFR